jgi:nucleoside-diphosphate kinase
MAIERTFFILKPDAVNRSITGEIISRFEKKGLKIVGLKMIKLNDDILKEHYAHLVSKSFYPDLASFMMKSPVIVGVLEGRNAVEVVRIMCGVTDANKATQGTIRGDYAIGMRNIIHTSDSVDNAKVEVERFFKPNELFGYNLSCTDYLYAPDELQ